MGNETKAEAIKLEDHVQYRTSNTETKIPIQVRFLIFGEGTFYTTVPSAEKLPDGLHSVSINPPLLTLTRYDAVSYMACCTVQRVGTDVPCF